MSEFSGWSFALGVMVGAVQIMIFDWRMRRRRRRWLWQNTAGRNDRGGA